QRSRSSVLADAPGALWCGMSEMPRTRINPTAWCPWTSCTAAATPAPSISTASSLGHAARTAEQNGSSGASIALSPDAVLHVRAPRAPRALVAAPPPRAQRRGRRGAAHRRVVAWGGETAARRTPAGVDLAVLVRGDDRRHRNVAVALAVPIEASGDTNERDI